MAPTSVLMSLSWTWDWEQAWDRAWERAWATGGRHRRGRRSRSRRARSREARDADRHLEEPEAHQLCREVADRLVGCLEPACRVCLEEGRHEHRAADVVRVVGARVGAVWGGVVIACALELAACDRLQPLLLLE